MFICAHCGLLVSSIVAHLKFSKSMHLLVTTFSEALYMFMVMHCVGVINDWSLSFHGNYRNAINNHAKSLCACITRFIRKLVSNLVGGIVDSLSYSDPIFVMKWCNLLEVVKCMWWWNACDGEMHVGCIHLCILCDMMGSFCAESFSSLLNVRLSHSFTREFTIASVGAISHVANNDSILKFLLQSIYSILFSISTSVQYSNSSKKTYE